MTASSDFFVSYTQADKGWAEWIAWQLEHAGYTVTIQAWDFRPGNNFVMKMQQAAEDAERTLLVMSPDFLKSRFTAPEWAAAFAKDPTGELGLVVPVRVRACEPTGLLAQINYVDLVPAPTKDDAVKLLLEGVQFERKKPLNEPAVPTLERGAPGVQRRSAPEPGWPAEVKDAIRWTHKLARIGLSWLLLSFVFGFAVLLFLKSSLPESFEAEPSAYYTKAWIVGMLIAGALLGLKGLTRRRRLRTALH